MAVAAIPPFLSEIIDRLLQKSPEKRYQSAAEVAELLRRDLEEINRTSTDKLGELRHRRCAVPLRSKRSLLTLAAAGIIVLGAFTAAAAWQLGLFSRGPIEQVVSSAGGPESSSRCTWFDRRK